MAEKVSMNLLIDTRGNRVLFAEAGKDCVDFLFHILSLPVATIIRLLKAQEMVGSLPNLYKSLEDLSVNYIEPDKKKDTFLKPVAPVSSYSIPLLALKGASVKKTSYTCDHCVYAFTRLCPHCGRIMTMNVQSVASEKGGLVKGVVTYMVMDDLEVKPMSAISTIALLNKFNVKDVGALEERVVNLGVKEGLKLLKASLQSKSVLTDVFC